jgi:spore coat polysaccharide biosynthesis protein SpsF
MTDKNLKSAIFIAVRMKSTRLPRKALLEIKGRTVIEHLIDRLKTADEPDLVVLCTSTNPDDAVLVDVAERNGIRRFQGSEDDKLDRFLGAASKYDIDLIAAVDGDDILCDPVYIDKVIVELKNTDYDMVTCKNLPLGATSNGISVSALRKVCDIKKESDTEVWGGYFTDSGLFNVKYIEPDDPDMVRPDIRLTLDYPEDFELFKKIFNELYRPGAVFSLKEVVHLFNTQPELLEITGEVHKQYLEGIQSKVKKIKWQGERT